MFVPVVEVGGTLRFVNVDHIKHMTEMGEAQPDDFPPVDGEVQHTDPEGKPWATTWLHFDITDGLRVKGSPVQLLTHWMGAASNAQAQHPYPSRQQRRAAARDGNRIIVPSGISSVDLKRKG